MKTRAAIPFIALLLTFSCKKENPVPITTRTYRMGFQNSAPRVDINLYLQSLQLWSTRADAAMITTEVPWDSLYNGQSARQYVINNYQSLVAYYRNLHFKLWIYIDPANGLNRSTDANALLARGKSIADDDTQKIYRTFVLAMDSILRPDHLGLALETNLIRGQSSAAIYNGVKKAANAAAADIRKMDPNVALSASVQADYAWGKSLSSTTTNYLGVEQDFIDFPFMEELGISSYPYFNYSTPDELPLNYYSKLLGGRKINVFVSEGGWTSNSYFGLSNSVITSSPAIQQSYIERQRLLLENASATAVFQLTFTDIDVTHLPDGVDPTLDFFAYLGLMDINLNPKPALASWDATFKLTLKE